MHRMENTVTEPTDLAVEKNHIKSALKNSGYQNWVFSNSDSKVESTPEVNQKEASRKANLFYLSYKKAEVHTSFKPLTRIFASYAPKDKPPLINWLGLIFPEKSWKPFISERRSPPSIETRVLIWIPYGIKFLLMNSINATSGRKWRHHQPTVSWDQSLHF